MLSPAWQRVESQLESGEVVLGSFEPDLDDQFRYVQGLVVLTDRRLLSVEPLPAQDNGQPAELPLRSWRLGEITAIKTRDRAGLGILEVESSAGRLVWWRYTAGQTGDAHRFVERFLAFRRGESLVSDDESPDEEPHAIHASTRSLFRLVRFARARGKLIALGFVLTVAATAAGLMPTYLTGPMVDKVLVPYDRQRESITSQADLSPAAKQQELTELQKSQRDHFMTIGWYLLAFGGASVLAWMLSWTQGVVMAHVSERISADLRNETYAHLNRLSLEFFGGRRTGDLIARLSTDTERLCTFLSDNLVDFASDVLMIIGTVIILISMDPVMALVTFIPFPVIAWLVYRTRVELQHGFHRGGRAWGHMTSVLADTIPGMRVVKAFAQEQREVERFRRSNEQVLEANDRVNRVWTFFWPMVALLNQIGLLVVWACGALRIYDFYISLGELVVFLQFINRFYLRLESMSRMMTATQRAAASATRIFEILDRVPSVPEPTMPVHPSDCKARSSFAASAFAMAIAR